MTAAAEANRRVPGGPGTSTCGLTWGCRPFGPYAGPDAIAAVATTAERLGLHSVRTFERLLVARATVTGWRLKPHGCTTRRCARLGRRRFGKKRAHPREKFRTSRSVRGTNEAWEQDGE